MLLQAPVHLAAVARAAQHTGRSIAGLSGPWDQVVAAREALNLQGRPSLKNSREDLYALDLRDLVVPPLLTEAGIHCRHPLRNELDLLTEWRVGFAIEALGEQEGPALWESCRQDVGLHHRRGSDWLLIHDKTPASYGTFNAMLPDIVQIGGVWTPPTLRGRGYGRSVVAGSLLSASRQGVARAVLFADPRNPPAGRAYVALGFRRTGDFGLMLLAH